MLTVLVRTLILYAVSVVAMRLMGKRQVGQLQPYELVLALLISELAASPMENVGTPLLYGIVPILTMVFMHGALALLAMKSPRVRAAISGEPTMLMHKGVINNSAMRRVNYTVTDLLEALREQGYLNVAEVETAILETNGQVTAFPFADARPVCPQDMRLQVPREGPPLVLVADGRVQHSQLRRAGLDENWLRKQPALSGSLKSVLLCSLDTQGRLYTQKKGEKNASLDSALSDKQIVW